MVSMCSIMGGRQPSPGFIPRLFRVVAPRQGLYRASPGLAHSFFYNFYSRAFRAKKGPKLKKLRMIVLNHKPVEHEKATKRPTLLHKNMKAYVVAEVFVQISSNFPPLQN